MKNKTFPFLTLCALMALTISCTGTSGNDAVVSLGDTDNPVKYRDYIKSIELTLLRDDTTCLVGKIEKVVETSDAYYVLNQGSTAIVKFDKQGNSIDKLYNVGRAKGEYTTINDFSVDEAAGRLVVLCDYTKVMVCDLSLQIQTIHDWQMPMAKICAYRSKIYGFNVVENSIVTLSENGSRELIKGIKPAGWVFTQTDIFYKSDGKLLAALECDNNIYLIDGEEAKPYLTYTYDCYEEAIEQLPNTDIPAFKKKPLLKIQNLSYHQDTLSLFYFKNYLGRFAQIDMSNHLLLSDGQCIGSPTPHWNGQGNSVLAGTFADGETFPIDTTYIKRMNAPFDSSVEGSVIVKYCN